MTITMIIMATLAHCVGVLLDMLGLLILIRTVCTWRSVGILNEFNEAGRPLVDRTLESIARFWRRLIPDRPLSPIRSLLVTWFAVALARWFLALLARLTVLGT